MSTTAFSLDECLLPPSPPNTNADNNKTQLSGSQDFISLFHLNHLYNSHVKLYLKSNTTTATPAVTATTNTTTATTTTGKKIGFTLGGIKLGQELVDTTAAILPVASTSAMTTVPTTTPALTATPVVKKKIKFEKSYEHIIADIPGRNTLKKDSHFLYLVMNPDFPPVRIRPLDQDSTRDAFTLRTGPIPDFDASIFLETTSSSPKKKKKKRSHPQASTSASISITTAAGGSAGGSAGDDQHRGKKAKR